MRLLQKFGVTVPDIVNIYVLYVCSILELFCQVWNSALTLENSKTLERVQKTSLKIILKSFLSNIQQCSRCYRSYLIIKKKIETLPELCQRSLKHNIPREIQGGFFQNRQTYELCNSIYPNTSEQICKQMTLILLYFV